MRHGSSQNQEKTENEGHGKQILQQLNSSVVVLKYIEPPRQLLKTSNRMNSIYKKQFNHLPHIFKCCEQLHPLAETLGSIEYRIDPELFRNVYRRDLQLKINPFQIKNYFRSTVKDFKNASKRKHQSNLSSQEQIYFDSNFESGNLLSVDKQIGKNNCYHLMMQNDINTYGCTQWFFYKASNKKPMRATFFINNFYKPQSLYQKGMKILIFSMKRYINQQVGWVRGGEQIIYFRNSITQKKSNGETKQFYSLKFNYSFQYEDDEVYFAYSYPYTFSRLNNFLTQKQKSMTTSSFYNCRSLCTTVAENKIFLVTITQNSIPKNKKSSIFITSRVHPGQTVSSLIMQGMINFLTSSDPIALQLREKFVFKLVPMLNPDGVIHGNYRTNLAGIDLNRVWDSTDSELSPQIYQIKKHITQFNKQCPIIMFCDLHGHSARKSAFIYGCQNNKIKFGAMQEPSRLFPFMLSFLNQDFRFKSCNFSVQKNKKGTARVQLWKQLKIPNIFTLQASFCSAENSQYHFRPTDYSQIGISFCKNIHQYFLNNQKKKQFHYKLKSSKQYSLLNKGQSDDSESDNDLLDTKTLNLLKNGEKFQIQNKRKIEIQKIPNKINEEIKQTNLLSRKRYISQSNKRHHLTQGDFETNNSIISFKSKKLISSAIATKKITIDTEILKPSHLRGYYPANSIFQRIQHNYRGKSSIYRIHRKNLRNITIEPSIKKQRFLCDSSALGQY